MTAICNDIPRRSLFQQVLQGLNSIIGSAAANRGQRNDRDIARALADAPEWLRHDLGIDGGARLDDNLMSARTFVPGQALREHLW